MEDGRVGSRYNKTGGVLPVLCRRLRRQSKERGDIDRISARAPTYLRKPRLGTAQGRLYRIVEEGFVGRQHADFNTTLTAPLPADQARAAG